MKFSRLIATIFLYGSILLGNTTWAENEVKYSGFLDHYPDLMEDPDGSGGLTYEKADIDHCRYDKIMIEPIEVWMAEDSKYKGFSPDVLKAVTDELYRSLEVSLEPEYPVVGEPGEGVVTIRLAITDVHGGKTRRGLVGYLPIGAVYGSMKGKYRRVNLKDATIEVEILDSQTLDQLGVLIDRLSLSKVSKGQNPWEQITDALHTYAEQFRADIDVNHSDC